MSNLFCSCLSGYNDDLINEQCFPCHYSCLSCSGASSNNCISCPNSALSNRFITGNTCPCSTGFYDNIGSPTCGPCHYSCLTCVNSNLLGNCLTCPDPLVNFRNSINTLQQCTCKNRFYDDGLF